MKAIVTKYFGSGNVRGSRLVASDSDGNRISKHYDDTLSADGNHDAAAKALCVKMGWTRDPLMSGHFRQSQRVYVSDQHAARVRFSPEEQEAGREVRERRPK